MSKRTRYTISLLPTDLELIDHLERVKQHSTISLYVRNLIKNDINESHTKKQNIDDIIEKVIQRIKEDDKLHINFNITNQESSFGDEQRNIISSLF